MIDGRGHVRITDFGLAALAGEVPGGDIRSGTPARHCVLNVEIVIAFMARR